MSRVVYDYKFIVADVERIERRVNRALADGWKLYGNHVVTPYPVGGGTGFSITQAMVRTKRPARGGACSTP